MSGPANSLNITQPGYVVFDGVSVFTGRTFQAGTGITLSNASGIAGNTTITASGSVPLSFNGNSGTATPALNTLNVVTSNTTVKFIGLGSTLTENFGLTNLMLGSNSASITSAVRNVGVGLTNLNPITSGTDNTAVGFNALKTVTTASLNTAVGSLSQQTVSTGATANTSIGYASLSANTGSQNTALGYSALSTCSSGADNCAVGHGALSSISTGINNIGIGPNLFNGSSLTGANSSNIIIGNAGTIGDNNKIKIGTQGSGTSQQNECYIAGIASVATSNSQMMTVNTSTGQLGSVFNSISNSSNTILGSSSGNYTISGAQNTGFGNSTLTALTSGTQNTSLGYIALSNVSTGNANTGIGHDALSINNGSNNTAVGHDALFLSTGSQNTAVGTVAMAASGAGDNNTAIGYGAGRALTSGNNNTLVGLNALVANTSGTVNTIVGTSAFTNHGSGSYNVGIGYLAGASYTTSESSNILIMASGTVGESNVLRIGTAGSGSGQVNKAYIAGINGVTVTGTAVLCATDGQLGTISSSERYKENIVDMAEDVSVIKLRPVEFNYKGDKSKTKQFGLIAEEVDKDFPYLCFYDKDGIPESVKYHELCTFLLKEVQRLNQRVEILENQKL